MQRSATPARGASRVPRRRSRPPARAGHRGRAGCTPRPRGARGSPTTTSAAKRPGRGTGTPVRSITVVTQTSTLGAPPVDGHVPGGSAAGGQPLEPFGGRPVEGRRETPGTNERARRPQRRRARGATPSGSGGSPPTVHSSIAHASRWSPRSPSGVHDARTSSSTVAGFVSRDAVALGDDPGDGAAQGERRRRRRRPAPPPATTSPPGPAGGRRPAPARARPARSSRPGRCPPTPPARPGRAARRSARSRAPRRRRRRRPTGPARRARSAAGPGPPRGRPRAAAAPRADAAPPRGTPRGRRRASSERPHPAAYEARPLTRRHDALIAPAWKDRRS